MSDPGLDRAAQCRGGAQGIDDRDASDKRLGGLKSHGKMMLIDGTRAVVGSLALTALSLDFRREVALVVDEPAAVAEIEQCSVLSKRRRRARFTVAGDRCRRRLLLLALLFVDDPLTTAAAPA